MKQLIAIVFSLSLLSFSAATLAEMDTAHTDTNNFDREEIKLA